MREPRIYLDRPIASDATIELDERAARHLLRVLRMRPGDPFLVFNGDGRDWQATLERSTENDFAAQVGGIAHTEPEPNLRVHLLLGILKGERMDFALQKAVELGVHRITPLCTKRVVVRLDRNKLVRRQHHWRAVVVSATEQSGRCRIPELTDATDLNGALACSHATGILLDPGAEHSLADLGTPDTDIGLMIGPEGGLATEERTSAVARGYRQARLGPRVLRAETAPLAALAALQVLWGDLR